MLQDKIKQYLEYNWASIEQDQRDMMAHFIAEICEKEKCSNCIYYKNQMKLINDNSNTLIAENLDIKTKLAKLEKENATLKAQLADIINLFE